MVYVSFVILIREMPLPVPIHILVVVVFRDGSDEIDGKPVFLVKEVDGVVLLVPYAQSVWMSYPKKVPAVLIDSEHIVLLETAGFGVYIIGLGFRIDNNESPLVAT